jgi:SAM-dependent methyltransferase
MPPALQQLKSMTDESLHAHASTARSNSVFALAYSSALHHATIAAKRHVLDIGCGGGGWSLLLAGPTLHVTVVVSSTELHVLVLRMVYALNVRDHVTVIQSRNMDSADEFLSVLGDAAALRDAEFMGFEMVVMLDLLSRLPPVLVEELSAALRPYMHTRSKALISAHGIHAAVGLSATEWCGRPVALFRAAAPLPCFVQRIPCHPLQFAGTSPIGSKSPWPL